MKEVLLIDPNILFSRRIQEMLNKSLQPFIHVNIDHIGTKINENIELIIIHESLQSAFKDLIHSQKKILFLKEFWDEDFDASQTILRQSGLSYWKHKIIEVLESEYVFAHSLNEVERVNRIFLFQIFNAMKYQYYFQSFIKEQLAEGKQIFILPIKPLYQWYYHADFNNGHTMFDVILQIEKDIAIDSNSIGQIFEKQKNGVFIARPSQNCDDLFHVNQHDLLLFLQRFRDFILSGSKEAIGIIDFDGLPVNLLISILPLSDVCLIDLSEESYYGNIIEKEIFSTLLARKPPNLRVKLLNNLTAEDYHAYS